MSPQDKTPRQESALNGKPSDQTLTLRSIDKPRLGLYSLIKPGVEFSLALIILLLSLPIVLLAALLVKLTSRGPVLYTQTRIGKDGKPFTLYKIRSMVHNCESESGAVWSTPGDSRVTTVGCFLRWSHIDEFPQLWNVLRGEMSLVGPRPERPEFIPKLAEVIPYYRDRLHVRPGITGLAQIQLPPDTTIESVRRKLAHDIYYIQRVSFWLDFRILASTGLRLVGVPSRLTQSVLRIPGGQSVEDSYENMVSKPATKTKTKTKTKTNLQPA